MCNLYHLAPRDVVETYFRVSLPAGYREVAVGPYNDGLILRGPQGDPAMAQWGMVPPGSKSRRPASRSILTNNARAESVHTRPTYRTAWAAGQRCLIPAAWYQEPNWETGRNIWWRLRRADGAPWALAGVWADWTDPATGEIVPTYSLLTVNCDDHPLLNRLHKPDPALPPDAQDKRSVVALEPVDWAAWLGGDLPAVQRLLQPPPLSAFDPTVSSETDAKLRGSLDFGPD